MTITQIDTNVQQLVKNFKKESFLYDFMRAFDFKNATIARLQKGTLNMSKEIGETIVKKKFWFKELTKTELAPTFQKIKKLDKIKHDPRFVILTDYKTILAYDTKTNESLNTTIQELTKNYAFFLPLAGMEKTRYLDENPADVKAAEKMAKLFDEIKKNNATDSSEALHQLNVFLSRLLFCFFAEDTQIFSDNQFTNAISSHTQDDGSDLKEYLTTLFAVLNQAKRPAKLAKHLADFPYVNGGLFQEEYPVPVFSKKARKLVIECGGDLDWSAINPDIFGSMIQAVVTPEHRGGLGMHYTSVPNIMKVIEPLFLDDLYGEFKKSFNSPTKLKRLHLRLTNLKFFDPACGSGNFLIIAYKEIRKLEMTIFRQLARLGEQGIYYSSISLSQFYGIELDDFAHEIASLSLWLAEHQMRVQFHKEFGNASPSLPLKEGGNIVHGNACRLDWEVVCPKEEGDEIYILGNPPYLGSSMQNKEQKANKKHILSGFKSYKDLDYIACWFYLGAQYIRGIQANCAFVSTNSICQGEQVSMLWPQIFQLGVEISFSYLTFKWTNSAKSRAGVMCVIVGIQNKNRKPKRIYSKDNVRLVNNISPYLLDGNNQIVRKKSETLSDLPKMLSGNKASDGGNLILNEKEKNELLGLHPESKEFIKKLVGALEFIRGKERWCLYIPDERLVFANSIPIIQKRLNNVVKSRLKSSEKSTVKMADYPNRFYYDSYNQSNSIIIPSVSSHRRSYVPIGFLGKDEIIVAPNLGIYNASLWNFSILTSRIHMLWLKTVGGRLKSDYRYSSSLVYNTFPFPKITKTQKEELETHVYAVLEQREQHSEKTLAQLYDPDKMPEGLRAAHHELDLAVERCYRKEPFTSDEERLAYLFKLYEKMIAAEAKELEKEKGTKKSRKK